MSDHIDWTEQAGEAVLAQTDDVLDAIQRLRATAQVNGYLVGNEARTVATEGDTIVIQPADPQVIYVPTYDSEAVYAEPAPAPPTYYYGDYDDDGWEDALVAGGIILGGAIILDEILDDDDWDGWGDWNDDVDIDWDGGDITTDRGDIDIDRDDINIDRNDIGGRESIGMAMAVSTPATVLTGPMTASGWESAISTISTYCRARARPRLVAPTATWSTGTWSRAMRSSPFRQPMAAPGS